MASRASAATGGLPAALAARVLRLDRLTHRLQAAAEQLLGHRDLLGPQRRQHGVAVHGRRGRDRALAPGRAPVALAGPAAAGPARPAPAPRASRSPRSSVGASSRARLRRRRRVAAVRAAAASPCARRRRRARRLPEPGARMTDTSGARSGVPLTSMRPSVFSGERAGLAAVSDEDLDAVEARLRPPPAAPRRRFSPAGTSAAVDGALGLARARRRARSTTRRPSGSSTRCRSGVTCGGHATSPRPRAPMPGPDGHPVTWAPDVRRSAGAAGTGDHPPERCGRPMSLQEDPHE